MLLTCCHNSVLKYVYNIEADTDMQANRFKNAKLHFCAYCTDVKTAKYSTYTKRRLTLRTCSDCSYSTHDGSNFRKHVRIHTGNRPYMCTVCNKSFTLKHHLKNHMITYNHGLTEQ
ncbi:RE1-silencing transcription factor B-like isoform X4 [Parasteatoda tepidariorum]|uniref:RE1-silencing transcription factor B-like isoform X4 n=1 Tax=Parasteatoda tepidariorum TaxID=114398 RepID=UPI0039BC2692